jgi:ligand-binding SRPBCC domain-containing protein
MHRALAFGAPEYTLQRTQWVPIPLHQAFRFFEDPHNLPKITPASLGFHIVAMHPDTISTGTRIEYRLKWFGIPYRWVTRIEDWQPGVQFADTQRNGPYILWHHTHTFQETAGGVLMQDTVRYRLPFGPLGVLMHRLLVRRQLDEIFDYRVQRIAELLSDGKVYREAPPAAA